MSMRDEVLTIVKFRIERITNHLKHLIDLDLLSQQDQLEERDAID